MSKHHQKSRFRKSKGQASGVFGRYVSLVTKEVPISKRRALLDSNAPLSQYAKNENEVLRKLAESMAHGVYGPCPICSCWNLKFQFKLKSFRCMGEKDQKEECTYMSANPPSKPFAVSDDFLDIEFLKNYNFDDRAKIAEQLEITEKPDPRPQKKFDDYGYVMSEKTNELFEQYYKKQAIVPEDEWEQFLEVLRTPLPATFRVTGYKSQARELLKVIQSDYFSELSDVYIDDKKIEPPTCLPWYPEGLAWQLNLERKVIRHHAVLARLKQFLVTETESGHISRQEAVSMIPPLVLDVRPHHKVLDMCAAPGSKTAQLVEALHADEESAVPEGFVVANDSDNKRCYLMVHQVKRLQSPCFTIINHDASQLPGMKMQTESGVQLVKFDRVLADVPCTGDGTFRKNVDAWQKWNSAAAHNLHLLQCRILKRGLDILTEGGRLVYSTCSLNPVENEAVIANVLSHYEGSVELLDVSQDLPGLKYTPGRNMWQVMARNGEWFERMEQVPEKLATQIRPSMFPPSAEVADTLHLDRCIRILPHLQNTGGFFVAVMVKTEDIKTRLRRLKQEGADETEKTADKTASNGASDQTVDDVSKPDAEAPAQGDSDKPAIDADLPDAREGDEGSRDICQSRRREKRFTDDPDNPPPLKKQRLRGFKEDPFVFLQQDAEVWPSIKEFFGIRGDYPVEQLMIRCRDGKGRNLYFVSSAIKQLVQNNEDKIRFINHGLRILNKSISKYCICDYRLTQDGIEHLYPWMSARIVRATRNDLIMLLTGEAPFIRQMSSRLQDQLNALEGQGSIVYVYDPDDEENKEDAQPRCRMAVTGWKGLTSARTFLPKHDRAHYLRLCGVEFSGEITKLEKHTQGSDAVKENEDMDSADLNSSQSEIDKSGNSTGDLQGEECDSKKNICDSNNVEQKESDSTGDCSDKTEKDLEEAT